MLEILFGLILLIFVGYIIKIAFLAVVISGSGLEVVSIILTFCVFAILYGFVVCVVRFADDEIRKHKRTKRTKEAQARLEAWRRGVALPSFLDDPDFHNRD